MAKVNKLLTLLLAEDSEDDVFFFRHAMEKVGMEHCIQLVQDGEEAVEYLDGIGKFHNRKRFPLPDFLFLDINMPKKNGWEVLEWMAGKPGLKHIPVAVVTTSEHHRDVKRAQEFSLRGYLVKPARPEQLKKLLEEAD